MQFFNDTGEIMVDDYFLLYTFLDFPKFLHKNDLFYIYSKNDMFYGTFAYLPYVILS